MNSPEQPSDGQDQQPITREAQHEADPRDIAREIDQVRTELTDLARELDRRRHDAMDVKIQMRQHPLAAAIIAAAGLMLSVFVARKIYLRSRPVPMTERAQKLGHALRLAARDPDRLLQALERRPDPRTSLFSALLKIGTTAGQRAVASVF